MSTKPDIAAFTADIDLATSALGKAGSKQASNDTFKLIFSKIKPLGKGYSDFFFHSAILHCKYIKQTNKHDNTHNYGFWGEDQTIRQERECFFFAAPLCIANILNRQINTATHIIMVSGGKIKTIIRKLYFNLKVIQSNITPVASHEKGKNV